jgi:hypothetical protein
MRPKKSVFRTDTNERSQLEIWQARLNVCRWVLAAASVRQLATRLRRSRLPARAPEPDRCSRWHVMQQSLATCSSTAALGARNICAAWRILATLLFALKRELGASTWRTRACSVFFNVLPDRRGSVRSCPVITATANTDAPTQCRMQLHARASTAPMPSFAPRLPQSTKLLLSQQARR